ncbi:hypothetical protein N9H34_01705 [bacterium]|nr:hypothetical protein [bacterium]
MYPNFKWWIGVVEDRADPAQLGRCKVRIIGYHTEDLVELPTTELPWAVPIMPMTSASISGVGETPAYVEGTTVVGFFSDGEDEQVPIIFGTLPGKPRNKRTDSTKGFADPNGVYPREGESGLNGLQEPDLSRLARNAVAEGHQSLTNKRATRQEAIPRAAAPHIDSIQDDKAGAVYDREIWEEPHPRFGEEGWQYNASNQAPNFDNKTSAYPYNKVTETETGHVFEVDDTPNNGRIHEYHNAGTFYEIQADGSKTTKVVGDEYEITLKDKKVYIKGTCDVTIGGDARMLVTGDMYQEIGGNLFTTVGGDRITKVVGNDMTEVLSSQSTNVSRNTSFRSGGDHTNTIVGSNTESVGGSKFTMVAGSSSSHVLEKTSMISGLGVKILSATGNMKLLAPIGTFKAASLNMSLKASANQTLTSAVQLVEANSLQTLSSLGAQILLSTAQNTISPARSIIGNTTHTGNLTVIGVASGTIVRQGPIVLGTHKHPANMTPPVP